MISRPKKQSIQKNLFDFELILLQCHTSDQILTLPLDHMRAKVNFFSSHSQSKFAELLTPKRICEDVCDHVTWMAVNQLKPVFGQEMTL